MKSKTFRNLIHIVCGIFFGYIFAEFDIFKNMYQWQEIVVVSIGALFWGLCISVPFEYLQSNFQPEYNNDSTDDILDVARFTIACMIAANITYFLSIKDFFWAKVIGTFIVVIGVSFEIYRWTKKKKS